MLVLPLILFSFYVLAYFSNEKRKKNIVVSSSCLDSCCLQCFLLWHLVIFFNFLSGKCVLILDSFANLTLWYCWIEDNLVSVFIVHIHGLSASIPCSKLSKCIYRSIPYYLKVIGYKNRTSSRLLEILLAFSIFHF